MTQIDEVLVCGVWGETSDVEICPGQRLSLLGCHPPGVRGWRPASSSSSIVARGEGRGDARQKMTWSSIPNTGIEVRGGEVEEDYWDLTWATSSTSAGPSQAGLASGLWGVACSSFPGRILLAAQGAENQNIKILT